MAEVERGKGKGLYYLDLVALVLLIIGGLNWLTVGLFNWNFVEAIFGASEGLVRFIYIIVGICAIYVAIVSPMLLRHVKMTERTATPPPATGTY